MALEIFKELFEHYGGPTNHKRFEGTEVEALPTSLPKALLEYFSEYGRAQFYDGRLQTCHPNDLKGVIALIFGADKQINHKNCFPFAYTAFGELYCWVTDIGSCRVKIYDGEVYSIGITKGISKDDDITGEIYVPFSLDKEDHDYVDRNGKGLFNRSVKKSGPLERGECYGFFPTLAMGGLPDIEFIKRTNAAAHFAFVAETLDYNLIDVQGYGKSVVVRPIG